MDRWLVILIFCLLVMMMAGLWRVFGGPIRADRMLAVQLCGSSTVAIFLLLAWLSQDFFLYDMALVTAILTSVATIAFVRFAWQESEFKKEQEGA